MCYCRCGPGQFNLHPFQAGCFPSSPVNAVSPLKVNGLGKTPILWFRNDLLEHLLITRQHQPRMGLGRAAAALRQHMIDRQTWDNRVSQGRFEGCLGTCLHQFAVLYMSEKGQQAMGLPPEGLLSCCHVCRQGHREFLVQQGVLEDVSDIPLLKSAVDGSAGKDAIAAAAEALQAAMTASAASSGVDQSHESGDAPQPQCPATETNSNTAGSAYVGSSVAQTAADGAASGVTAAAGAAGIQGLGGSYLPARSKPAEWHATLQQLNQNPLQAFSPYTGALVIHSIYFDGLRRVAHFARAGT